MEAERIVRSVQFQVASDDDELSELLRRAPGIADAPHAVVLRDERHVKVAAGQVESIRHVCSILVRSQTGIERYQEAIVAFNAAKAP